MFTSYSYKEALRFYHKHPRAFGIQKFKRGVTAGLIQPDMPSRITIDGHTYRRPYVGTFPKRDAQQLARSFRKNKLFKGARVRKFKRGYQVYVRS